LDTQEADTNVPLTDVVVDPAEREDEEVSQATRYTLTSYGADYPVDGLVKRLRRGDIFVPDFQRGFVWSHAQASRFLESLLLGLPVPGIFLYKEPDTQKLMVVDGQQRLQSLRFFYDGVLRAREFSLKGVTTELAGRTYKTLSEEDRRRLDDAIVHATIFGQDTPTDDRSSVYMIFERLNTGGTPLHPQEIRSCVYRGPFNDLLRELAALPEWRELYGPASPRGKDQEIILRFFALIYDAANYHRPMSMFLNEFMDSNRRLTRVSREQLSKEFAGTVQGAVRWLGASAFRPEGVLNAALTDAILVGLGRRLARGPIENPQRLRDAYGRLVADETFKKAYTKATTDPTSVQDRLRLSTEAFASLA